MDIPAFLNRHAERPAAAAVRVGVIAVVLQPVYLMVAGAFEPFPWFGYAFWLPWFLVMSPGITLFRWIGPKTHPLVVTLVSLVFGAALWGLLAFGFLAWYSRSRGQRA